MIFASSYRKVAVEHRAGEFNISPVAALAPDARLAEVERNLDRTSDAFVDAVNLLDRCLPQRFRA